MKELVHHTETPKLNEHIKQPISLPYSVLFHCKYFFVWFLISRRGLFIEGYLLTVKALKIGDGSWMFKVVTESSRSKMFKEHVSWFWTVKSHGQLPNLKIMAGSAAKRLDHSLQFNSNTPQWWAHKYKSHVTGLLKDWIHSQFPDSGYLRHVKETQVSHWQNYKLCCGCGAWEVMFHRTNADSFRSISEQWPTNFLQNLMMRLTCTAHPHLYWWCCPLV